MSRDFSFKQFTVKQTQSAFKVGTDSVVLGAWADVEHARHILDIGTGTGLLALQCAQRVSQAHICAIDKDGAAVREAAGNFAASPWAERLHAEHLALEDLEPVTRYDYLICNPPYFLQALLPPDDRKADARHVPQGWFTVLARQAEAVSLPGGIFGCVLPQEGFDALHQAFTAQHWHLRRIRRLLPCPDGKKVRVLAEWHRLPIPTLHLPDLCVRNAQGDYDEAYRALTAAFYLK